MALKSCRECQHQVSTGARTCPRCGVHHPATSIAVRRIGAVASLGAVLLLALTFYSAHQDDKEWIASYPGQVRPDARTGRAPLDHSKPIYAVAGAPVCPSERELDAFRQHAPSACLRVSEDRSVASLESKGFLVPVYRVRFLGFGAQVVEGWIPYEGLRN